MTVLVGGYLGLTPWTPVLGRELLLCAGYLDRCHFRGRRPFARDFCKSAFHWPDFRELNILSVCSSSEA